MKKLLLITLLLIPCSSQPALTYRFYSLLGMCADLFLAKSDLSPQDEHLFKTMMHKAGVDDRDVQVKNAGFLLRLLYGYNNPKACEWFNRVYINGTHLEKMSTNQKKFLMARKLAHFKKGHLFEGILAAIGLNICDLATSTLFQPTEQHFDPRTGNYFVKQPSPIEYRYFVEGFNLWLVKLSFTHLALAQLRQKHEAEADEFATFQSGAHIRDGVKVLEDLYHPDTTNWPAYAQARGFVQRMIDYVLSLPVLKQHTVYPPSFDDRATYLRKLQNQPNNN